MRLVSRKNADRLITLLSLAITIIAIVPLLWIIGCVIANGASAINLEFLTDTPAPYGESGGGIANAILARSIINAMASLFGIPVGMLTGMYLSEYANSGKFSSVSQGIGGVLLRRHQSYSAYSRSRLL